MAECYGDNCVCRCTPAGYHAPMDDAERLAAQSGYLVSAAAIRSIRRRVPVKRAASKVTSLDLEGNAGEGNG